MERLLTDIIFSGFRLRVLCTKIPPLMVKLFPVSTSEKQKKKKTKYTEKMVWSISADEKEKRVLFCAVKKQNAPKTEQVVKEEDPDAFMIVTSATEIYGQGHKSYFTEKI